MQHLLRAPKRGVTAARVAAVTVALCAAVWAIDWAGVFPDAALDVRWGAHAAAAVDAAPRREVLAGLPVLSLVVAPDDLHGPRGILSNVLEHGVDWERRGVLAYFDSGRLQLSTDVGVRVHGGGSRVTSPRQGFRLYFRKRYGAVQVPRGVLFDADAQPITRLVVHNDVRTDADGETWRLANPLAYDIAEAMSAVAPDTKPVRFFLNGEPQGMFVLTERVDDEFFGAHFGHRQVRAEQADFDQLKRWVSGRRPLLMADVAQQIDLENLTRWFLAVGFCATSDAYQGPGQFRDLTRRDAPWFWVNWDMDTSFRRWDADSYSHLLEAVGGPPKGRNLAEPRAVILTRLLEDDPAFRAYLAELFDRVMNHAITPRFLRQRLEHYRSIAVTLQRDDAAFLERLREFLERRPAFFRLLTEQRLNFGPSQPLRVTTPAGTAIAIDGEVVRGRFEGSYFQERQVRLSVREGRERFVEWRVNDVAVSAAPELSLSFDQPTDVAAVFTGERPVPFDSPRDMQVAGEAPAPAAPLRWVRLPPGEFEAGCIRNDPDCDDNERPAQPATIERPFSMLTTEVTAGQYAAFANATGRRMPRQPTWFATAGHPVVNVTWDEAEAFCQANGGRLPTELEWEYAARGGASRRLFPWEGGFNGQANLEDLQGLDRFRFTAPVDSMPPNNFGLHGMIGNLWEWTADRYHLSASEYDYDIRALRGGSWITGPRGARISERAGLPRLARHSREVGFRCVRAGR